MFTILINKYIIALCEYSVLTVVFPKNSLMGGIKMIQTGKFQGFVQGVKENVKKFFGLISIVLLLLFTNLSKLKFLLTFLKLGKFAGTFITMFLTIISYSVVYGWKFGVGIVVLIFIHEMGHWLCAKYLKIKVSAPVFIPFLGAIIDMKENPRDAVTEAKMAYCGPLLGGIGVIATYWLYLATGEKIFMAFTGVGALINLFNLIPVGSLDGGRIVKAISPKLWYIGIPIMLYFAFVTTNPIAILIVLIGLGEAYDYWRTEKLAKKILQNNFQIKQEVVNIEVQQEHEEDYEKRNILQLILLIIKLILLIIWSILKMILITLISIAGVSPLEITEEEKERILKKHQFYQNVPTSSRIIFSILYLALMLALAYGVTFGIESSNLLLKS